MKRFIFLFAIISAVTLFSPVSAQVDNHFFYDIHPVDTAFNKSLRIGADLLPFIKNNEYFNNIVEGYTLFGYQLKPYLSLYPSKNVRIDAGGYFLRDFGGHRFRQIKPYFMVKYVVPHFSIIFGDIEGTLTHRILEPLYDFERIINKRMEEGLQFKWDSRKLNIDTWINWENFIQLGDSDQEIFNAGLQANYYLVNVSSFTLSIPLQVLARHHGGQINVGNAPVYTVYNTATGIRAGLRFRKRSWLEVLQFEGYYLGYSGEAISSVVPYSGGNGILAQFMAGNRFVNLYVSYWKGHDFYAPIGTPYYQSVSVTYAGDHYSEADRNLLFFRLCFQKKLSENLDLAFRFEPIYDLDNHILDHSESLYLRFNTSWHLLKL